MLVLSRKLGQKIRIGEDVIVTVLDCRGDTIRVGVEAPRSVLVLREELYQDVSGSNQASKYSQRNEDLNALLNSFAPPARNAQVAEETITLHPMKRVPSEEYNQ